jgi:uncharacterized ferritin-like protein (DUF455 family)
MSDGPEGGGGPEATDVQAWPDVQAWAQELLSVPTASAALGLGKPPVRTSNSSARQAPDRPARLEGRVPPVRDGSKRSFRRSSLGRPRGRAELLARFAHHELQAAELMAWALLRFGGTPRAFRAGLARIAWEELEHARLLERRVRELGHDPEEFGRRDWFWERVVQVAGPGEFCAMMGLGLEGANLEHAELWAERLHAAGDEVSARIQERIGREELAHVRFARRWFERFLGPLEFDRWAAALPAPLTPGLLRGPRMAREARLAAGFDADFIAALERAPRPGAQDPRSGDARA